ncbi:hypothetical protein TrVGV298_008972 [Trichoderma virens]|nr:hypothetical protein TrVGV298_008972 [Trichoderma virens]
MEIEPANSPASPQKSRSSTPLRRKKTRRYHKTTPKKRTPTPRSSPTRCSKSPRKANQSPMKLWGDDRDGGGGQLVSGRILESMETEKRRYLGNHQLNELEERLFEILFLRQEIPLLPLHWGG